MGDMIFNSFSEAASYAKERAKELGISIKLERRDQKWVVLDLGGSSRPDNQNELEPKKTIQKNYQYKKQLEEIDQEQTLINAFWRKRSKEEELMREIRERGPGVFFKKFNILRTEENIELLEKIRKNQKKSNGAGTKCS